MRRTKRPSKLETIVSIDENNNCIQIVQRLLTNNRYEAKRYTTTFDDKVYEFEFESNYNDDYNYCVSLFIHHNIITDLV